MCLLDEALAPHDEQDLVLGLAPDGLVQVLNGHISRPRPQLVHALHITGPFWSGNCV